MTDLLAALEAHLQQPTAPALKKRRVELILGNDREIGRETRSQEKRVGITPGQVGRLRRFFASLGIELSTLVLQGAGQRAGFSDGAFIAEGAEIITPDELPYHDAAPDVVHALKEPSRYESRIPGPFCRIGALHTGDFHADAGLAGLLEKQDVAIFDGSHIGAPASFRTPIRGRMSVFAGEVAARWVLDDLERLQASGRVLVIGAGNAGQAAVRKLARSGAVTEIHLFDSAAADRRSWIDAAFAAEPKVRVRGLDGMDDPGLLESLEGAAGIVFAVARPGEGTPKVVHVDSLRSRLAENAVVVDVSIDEGGAVYDPAIQPGWSHVETIPHLVEAIGAGSERLYRALPNMPRARPQEASEAHGEIILPYVATLLFLAAREGGAPGVVRYLEGLPYQGDCTDPHEAEAGQVLDALLQDLRNGMAFYPHGGKVTISHTVADRAGIVGFLDRQAIPYA
jgi:alanine dehydrogenase